MCSVLFVGCCVLLVVACLLIGVLVFGDSYLVLCFVLASCRFCVWCSLFVA